MSPKALTIFGWSEWTPVEQQNEPQNKKSKKVLADKSLSGLTYKQQLKQDAMLWAEFLYTEYKRQQAHVEEAQVMPTHYDKQNT